jgi:hypothetical protein
MPVITIDYPFGRTCYPLGGTHYRFRELFVYPFEKNDGLLGRIVRRGWIFILPIFNP